MPIMSVWKCPVCETQTEPFTGVPPADWITVAGHASTPEVFDKWQCAATWAQEHSPPE
jgi:hypothetical protein